MTTPKLHLPLAILSHASSLFPLTHVLYPLLTPPLPLCGFRSLRVLDSDFYYMEWFSQSPLTHHLSSLEDEDDTICVCQTMKPQKAIFPVSISIQWNLGTLGLANSSVGSWKEIFLDIIIAEWDWDILRDINKDTIQIKALICQDWTTFLIRAS